MSRFGWGERVVVYIKKKKQNHLAKLFLLGWQSKGEFY